MKRALMRLLFRECRAMVLATSGLVVLGANPVGAQEATDLQEKLVDVQLDAHADISALAALAGSWRLVNFFVVDGEEVAGPDGYVEIRTTLNGRAVVKEGYHPSPRQEQPVFASSTVFTYSPDEEAVVASSNNTLGNLTRLALATA